MIYLDNAATTYPKPEEVYKAMDHTARNMCVNAGRGSYKMAREASALLVETKKMMRDLIHVDQRCPVVFSPSITVAINQIGNGLNIDKGANVFVSPYEHNAVARCLESLSKRNGFHIRQIPIDKDTLRIDIDQMRYEFSKNKPAAVFCTHVSNVTGYILPIKDIFSASKKYGAVNVLDSAQSLGIIDVHAESINVDIVAFAGHKTLYGPLGIGGFVNCTEIQLSPALFGGTGSDSLNLDMPNDPEGRYEAGSQNIIAISGLNAALKVLKPSDNRTVEKELTAFLIDEIGKIKKVRCITYGNLEDQTGIVSFTVDGYNSSDIGLILDEDYDIAVRTGYHCAPYIHEKMGVIKNMGTVRVGVGRFNTKEDINSLISAIKEIVDE